jgi:hypothetical protein
LILATVGWGADDLYKSRSDFRSFVSGKVYMQIHGRQYEARVVSGVRASGRHVLYDMVDMEPVSFELKKEEDASSAPYSHNERVAHSETSSTADIIAQDFGENKRQLRDPDQVSDRELLANAMDSVAQNEAELDFVRRYRKQIEQLDQKQRELNRWGRRSFKHARAILQCCRRRAGF